MVPFHVIATDFPLVVSMVADHLGAGHLRDQALENMTGQISKLPEFNKGIADRFTTELCDEDLLFVCANLKEEAALYDVFFRDVMGRHGRLKQADELIAKRDAQIFSRLRHRVAGL